MTKLPPITTKQQEILKLLYRYRFLDRKQIQALLGHKDKRRVVTWLQDLREKEYVAWRYDATDFAAKTKPAIYYLALNGIRYLREFGEYPGNELRKRYKESTRQDDFVNRCLLLADCSIHLEWRNKTNDSVSYSYFLEANYTNPDDDNDYSFLSESECIHPHLCFDKEEDTDKGLIESSYLLEVLDPTTPRYMVRKKLKGYVNFLDKAETDEWKHGKGSEELPIVLIACPTLAELIYAKRYTKKLLAEHDLDGEDVHIRFAAIDQVKRQGMTALIWEEA